MTTYATVMGRHKVDVPAHLEEQATIPVITGMQAQGDIIVLPVATTRDPGAPVPADGVPVVRGEATGNTHLLVAADGPVYWAPSDRDGLDCGHVTVDPCATAYLLHPEHGANGIGPGTYLVRRQREQADVIRRVAD